MNTKEKARHNISSFIQSKDRVLLLTGTHQYKKHNLALSVILSKYPPPAIILFRVNDARNIGMILSPILKLTKDPTIGSPINIKGGYKLDVDTINRRSWSSSPSDIDLAIVYPVDSFNSKNGHDCVQDLIDRNPKKVFLISCDDDKDFSWINQFNPVHAMYDAEEEDPEYHKRILDLLSSVPSEEILKGLPKYAKSIQPEFLVQNPLCRKCGCARWARLNLPYPGKSALRSAPIGKYKATCLVCGYEAINNNSWSR